MKNVFNFHLYMTDEKLSAKNKRIEKQCWIWNVVPEYDLKAVDRAMIPR